MIVSLIGVNCNQNLTKNQVKNGSENVFHDENEKIFRIPLAIQ